jgi:hypothetical protein
MVPSSAKERGDKPHLKLYNATTLAIADALPMNSWRYFGELFFHELR